MKNQGHIPTCMNGNRPKPMRQFIDQSKPCKRSWIDARVSLFFYFVAPLWVIPCIALTGYRIVQHFYSTSPVSVESLVEESDADTFVRRYSKALGGNEAIGQLELLNFSGTVFSDEGVFNFEGSSSRTEGYDVHLYNTDAIMPLDVRGASGEPLASSGSSGARITVLKAIFSDFDNPAIRYLLNGDGRVLEVERDHVGKIDLICLTIQTGPTMSSKLYFDERKMQLLAREDSQDDQVVGTYRYSDYQNVRGVSLPRTIVAQIKGLPALRINYSTLKGPPLRTSSFEGQVLVSNNMSSLLSN